jgi:hypothetical protein
MPKGKPKAGSRQIDPANRPGPDPSPNPRRSWCVRVTDPEKQQLITFLAALRKEYAPDNADPP